jgi:hypothetical protein
MKSTTYLKRSLRSTKIALAGKMRAEGQSYPQLKFEVSNLLTLCKHCDDAFHKAAGSPVHATIGPFLPAQKKFEVREQPAIYQYRLAA